MGLFGDRVLLLIIVNEKSLLSRMLRLEHTEARPDHTYSLRGRRSWASFEHCHSSSHIVRHNACAATVHVGSNQIPNRLYKGFPRFINKLRSVGTESKVMVNPADRSLQFQPALAPFEDDEQRLHLSSGKTPQ